MQSFYFTYTNQNYCLNKINTRHFIITNTCLRSYYCKLSYQNLLRTYYIYIYYLSYILSILQKAYFIILTSQSRFWIEITYNRPMLEHICSYVNYTALFRQQEESKLKIVCWVLNTRKQDYITYVWAVKSYLQHLIHCF